MSDQEIIREFFINKLWEIQSIPLILECKQPKFGKDYIGEVTGKFTKNNYPEMYIDTLDNSRYQISFQDESFISLYYKFSKDGEIERYNLSFIPSIDMDATLDTDNSGTNFDFGMLDYMRLDYDPQGFQKVLHELQHLHIGLSYHDEKDKEDLRNEFRIPVAEKLYPWDFIYLISKFIYHLDEKYDNIFKKFVVSRCQLIEIEEQNLHINFNLNEQ